MNGDTPAADVNTVATGSANEPVIDQTLSGEDKAPELLNFTQDALNAMLAKEKGTGKRSIMKQFGVEKEEDLETEIANYNAYKEALKSQETDAQRLDREAAEHAATKAEKERIAAELATLKQEKVLKSDKYKIKEDDMDYYVFKINQLVTNEIDFAAAADLYFKDHPVKQTPPPFSVGVGQDKIANNKMNMNDFIFNSLKK